MLVVGVSTLRRELIGGDDVDLGGGDAAAHDFAQLKMRTDVESRGGLLKKIELNPGVDQRAEQHVTTDAGKTLEITNTHWGVQGLRPVNRRGGRGCRRGE
jgi:hypothetical protein